MAKQCSNKRKKNIKFSVCGNLQEYVFYHQEIALPFAVQDLKREMGQVQQFHKKLYLTLVVNNLHNIVILEFLDQMFDMH